VRVNDEYNVPTRMRLVRLKCSRPLTILFIVSAGAVQVRAQEPPPKIPLVAFDIHATLPRFPSEQALADSRGMTLAELPGRGLGLHAAVTVYPVKWRAITFGIGGEVTANRASQTPVEGTVGVRASQEKFLSAAPQISFNFGSGHGWSYLSGGLGVSQWSLIPDGRDEPFPSDTESLKTLNYGGGARWFAKPHLAFSFDFRFYVISFGTPYLGYPGSPRTTLIIIGVGMSVK
jgi:hypothetical protein